MTDEDELPRARAEAMTMARINTATWGVMSDLIVANAHEVTCICASPLVLGAHIYDGAFRWKVEECCNTHFYSDAISIKLDGLYMVNAVPCEGSI